MQSISMSDNSQKALQSSHIQVERQTGARGSPQLPHHPRAAFSPLSALL